ncbi:MAG TPA: DUF3298 domain-containing protein [Paludibacteraceae bacterium]|nr:DUF3298 domain-containing protein [Paludibacteraceae bacterium]HOU69026.1 DUF3298 domain-containing protein [Paludibacteraceae bacterium]HPH62905.1 DUF3298 domain-containing protein [Paludibacteraceae bacterium]HQF50837.1 DUF3298 domain-containing protein [Paludibacteraceae bacterium]
MNKNTILFVVLSMIFAVCSCSSSKEKKAEENKIEFDSIKVDSTYHLFNDTTKPAISIDSKIIFPVNFGNDRIYLSIKRQMIKDALNLETTNDPKQDIAKYVENLIADYKKLEKIYKNDTLTDDDVTYVAEQNVSQEVTFNQDSILTIFTNTYSFSGGAHGMTIMQYANYDLRNGQKIRLSDLFADDYSNLLTPIILGKLVQDNKVQQPTDLEQNGFIDVSEIKPTENFYLDEIGITFVYNQYDIACYAMGQIKVFIPYSDLSFLILDNSRIKKYL